jgi:hypothetical protein
VFKPQYCQKERKKEVEEGRKKEEGRKEQRKEGRKEVLAACQDPQWQQKDR